MPWSAEEGKPWIAERVVRYRPWSILDVGAGSGTYELVLRPLLPDCVFVAIEVHEPYLAQFDLEARYDKVIVGDARCLSWPDADVVILGDVLEHMPLAHAEKLWAKARRSARRAVFASVPLGHYPQGPMFDNDHEAHLHTWSHHDLMALPGVVAGEAGRIVGVYEASPVRITA